MPARIHQEETFDATPARLYEIFMSSEEHGAFTGGAAEIGSNVGDAYKCHDGQIEGRNVELVPGQRIVQAWRVANWEAGVYSVVKFELLPEGGGTRLVLDHYGIADEDRGHIESGWQTRYWEPLRRYLRR